MDLFRWGFPVTYELLVNMTSTLYTEFIGERWYVSYLNRHSNLRASFTRCIDMLQARPFSVTIPIPQLCI